MMRKRIIFVTIISLFLTMLTACSGGAGANETTTGIEPEGNTTVAADDEETKQEETTTEVQNEETTEDSESSGEDLTEESTTVPKEEETTEGNSTETETTKPAEKPTNPPTQKPSGNVPDKTVKYKEMEDYAKNFCSDYAYINNLNEFKKYAAAHEGKKFAIICDFGAFREGDSLKFYSAYDVVKKVEQNYNTSYQCFLFDWMLDEIVKEQKEKGFAKVYVLRSEKDIDAAIADFSQMADIGKNVQVEFIYVKIRLI